MPTLSRRLPAVPSLPPDPPPAAVEVRAHTGAALRERLPALTDFALAGGPHVPGRHPGWLTVLRDGLGHRPYAVEATEAGRVVGFLPLALVRGPLFGRFLSSLPYLNSNGVIASDPDVARKLVDAAVEVADRLDCRQLILRHETPVPHPALGVTVTSKVHMRLPLPDSPEALWKGFDAKVRNQIRKGEKSELTAVWGGLELLDAFHAIMARNMRDLGSPVYGRRFYAAILNTFPGDAELCVVSAGGVPCAAALLTHGPGVTEVPSASALREFNATCCNMFLYRHLLDRAVGRKQAVFDFGRSTVDGPTYKFKKQWGAVPHPAAWQYYVRRGEVSELKPDNPKFDRLKRLWQRLPVGVSRRLGPAIVRGVP